MVTKISIALVLICQTLLLSCKKENTDCYLIPAKILRADCDRIIFQLLTSESIGDANWVDVRTGQQYSNVAAYSNTCAISDILNNSSTDTLYVNPIKLTDRTLVPDCYQCQAISENPPLTNVDFKEISLSACNDSENL